MRLLLFILLSFFFSACERESKVTHFYGVAMTLPYHIQIGKGLSEKEKKSVVKIIHDTFDEIDQTYNHWNANSELSKLNALQSNISFPLSDHLLKLLNLAKDIYIISDERFDPTAGALIDLWKSALKSGRVPTQEEIKLCPSGWDNLHLENGIICKKKDLMKLDCDGIVKGLAVDLLIRHLQKANYLNLYIEWSGDIRTSGKHPENRPWQILITKNGNREDPIEIFPLESAAIATSGNYIQYWKVNGNETYTHIINPKTKKALQIKSCSISSCTVLAPTCALADALATAAMLFDSVEAAEKWALQVEKKYEGIKFWIFSGEGFSQ